ncbi:type II toxin-antitoxin system RelE/ParE family toxin [Dyadobacter sp. CY312]|uniref:type II toxin-antitoxin system RelE family toxin n=1 Tax=Dyadobacter sp. CY312 TaxID=2907303 RepID=UPI001F23907C|nr:type II toxin-antitoxin system RelE/ParE family toxin [Dyadobacter sp. CY312]MCE7040837.1 type II toxin-antitoxin system RelE/ParE family toxin [Dyadobacter sp. CY312]
MKYNVVLSKSAVKFLRGLQKQDFTRIQKAIDSLETDPFQPGCKKLKAIDNTYRIRAGNYRIVYEIYSGKLIVSVIDIGDRKNIYD